MARDSGALYVVIDGALHPTLNLASARLIMNTSESPKLVGDKKLRSFPRGPLLGIPGAPAALPGDSGASAWTVCDAAAGNPTSGSIDLAVIAGRPAAGVRPAAADEAVLAKIGGDVSPGQEGTYLLFGDRRARVDIDDPVVRSTLRLERAVPRLVSAGLLNVFRETPEIAVPQIVDRGAPSILQRAGVGVGSVVRVNSLDGGTDYYVVFADGVQRIGPLAAELLRGSDPAGVADVPTVAPAELSGLPIVDRLAVQDFPPAPPRLAPPSDNVMCVTWERGAGRDAASAGLVLGDRLPLPDRAATVRPASADGGGPGVDQMYVPPGTGRYVQATGSDPRSGRAESLFYVTDSGVRHGVADPATATVLGLGDAPGLVPSAVISLLPAGPSLSRAAALVSHDGIAPDRSGIAFDPPPRN